MKFRFLLPLVFVFCASTVSGQINSRTAFAVKSVASLPATCTYDLSGRVETVYKTGASAGYYTCKSTENGWDGPFATVGGTAGDVTGPGVATDEAVVRFSGTTGQSVQNSTVTITDGGVIAGATVADPTTAQQLASKNYIDQAVGTIAGTVPKLSGLASGGGVIWESAYVFRVAAATYYIQGILYSSAEQTITLTTADPALDRIDVLALNTSGTLVKVDGVAAAQPSEPDYDPSTQLKLTFVLVTANTTEPVGVSNENVYLENTEWTSSTSGSGWNAASTTNPRTGTKDIEGTNVANNAYVQLQRGSTTTLDTFGTLSLFIRSKASWNNNRVLRLQFFNAGVAKGNALTVASGYWGFDSSITASYQLLSIPVNQFAIPAGTLVNQLRITDSGGAIGLYIDDIVLQALGTTISPPAGTGITFTQGDARYAQRANNLSDLNSATTALTNLGVATATLTLTNKTLDVEAAGNVLSTVGTVWLAAAGCNNATAASFWDLPVTTPAVATCFTGTNIQKGVLDFADSGPFIIQSNFALPADWTTAGGVDATLYWTSTATTGDAKWNVSTACAAVGGTATDDPAFNTAQVITTTVAGTTLFVNTSTQTGLTLTGCTTATPLMFHVKVMRDGTAAGDTLGATARLIGVEIKYRRAQ